MTTHVIVLARAKADKAQGAKTYSEGVAPLLAAAGVKPVFRGAPSVLAGAGEPPATVMALEFDSADAAEAFFAQDAYQALVPLRDESFAQMEIYIVS